MRGRPIDVIMKGMKTSMKASLIVILFGSQALMWGRILWPPAPSTPQPGPELIPYFYILWFAEAMLFGLTVAFLLLIRASIIGVPKRFRMRAIICSLSLFWLLGSWWLHDNLHVHNGTELHGLIQIEYGFHLTSMIATIMLAENFMFLLGKLHATEDLR
jgi:hypothetical protein